MLCCYQIISVASWTFALIFCAWISVCRWFENPTLLSQQSVSIQSTGIIILLIVTVTPSPRGRPLATNSGKALQHATESLLLKLPLAAAVQSRGPDPNKFVDFSPAPALPARRTCHSNREANVQRPRAGAQVNRYVKKPLDANTYVHVFEAKILTKIHANICKNTCNTC